MRRKLFGFIATMMIAVMLSGCGNTDSKVDQVIQNQMQEADNKNSQSGSAKETEEDKAAETSEVLSTEVIVEESKAESTADKNIDVDLTKLSSTMVYSEVYNMMVSPDAYIGKTVKMRGVFVAYTNQDESQYYPAVIIADATACCSQGLEFLLEGNPSYPEGYPELQTEITVVGTFETYLENGDKYCRLQNAKME